MHSKYRVVFHWSAGFLHLFPLIMSDPVGIPVRLMIQGLLMYLLHDQAPFCYVFANTLVAFEIHISIGLELV